MAILVQFKQSGVTPDQYDKLRAELDWEAGPPKGSMFHAVGFADGEMRIVDVWTSQADFDAFLRDSLGPAAARHGLNPTSGQATPIHLMAFVPELLAANGEVLRMAQPA